MPNLPRSRGEDSTNYSTSYSNPKGKNKMKLTFALVVVLFAAATLADECQIYRGAVEKLAVEISSRQPRPDLCQLRMVFAKTERAGLAVERLSVWLWSAS